MGSIYGYGFKKIKAMMEDLEVRHGVKFAQIPNDEAERLFELSCLFEIAGNLDTIAVEMREQTRINKGVLDVLKRQVFDEDDDEDA